MSCPTCDHSMQGIGYGAFWCPRCGTLKASDDSVSSPALVERCRKYHDLVDGGRGMVPFNENLWRKLGVADSIALPERRPS